MKKGSRVCIVGSITGNTNTIGGGFVYPRADLGDLKGLQEVMAKAAKGESEGDGRECCVVS